MDELEIKIKELELEVASERERLSTDRMDISFGELINLYKSEELIIDPDYQRLFRWGIDKKTALIESLLLSIPIPPIFVAEDENGVWELVDGLQRVSTFLSFFGELKEKDDSLEKLEDEESTNEGFGSEEEEEEEEIVVKKKSSNKNKWELKAGGLIPSLKGFNIDNLPLKYKINLKRAVCRVEILRGKTNRDMKYELFKRLNSGGIKLTPQEIRNSIYRSENPEIIETVVELSKNSIFKKLVNISEAKKNELYDQELTLRFFAYYNNVDNIDENNERFLNKFLKKETLNKEFDITYYKNKFLSTLYLLNELNDEKIFKNEKNAFQASFYEGIIIGLAQEIENYRDLEKLREVIEILKNDIIFKDASGSSSNSQTRTKNRLQRAVEIFGNRQDQL